MSVTQPVVDQRQESAGCGDSRDLVPSRRSDPAIRVLDWWSALVAGNGFDRCPPHQGGALFRDWSDPHDVDALRLINEGWHHC